MALTIGVPAETRAGETRVALVPEVAGQLIEKHDVDVLVESGAGARALHTDGDYEAHGAPYSRPSTKTSISFDAGRLSSDS